MIHPLADVHSKNIGKDTDIWQFAVVLKGAHIGNYCNINCHTFIENDVIIGNYVTIKAGVYVWDGITIEDNVFVGPNVTLNNDPTPRSKQYPIEFQRTLIKKHASIGSCVNVLGGITIGEYSMIGASSLVTKDVPAFQLWFGAPAKHQGYVTKEGLIITKDLKDTAGNRYKLINNEPVICK